MTQDRLQLPWPRKGRCTALHCTAIKVFCATLHCMAMRCSVQCMSLRCTVHCMALRCTVQCMALCCTVQCIALHCTIHYMELHYTVQCMTLCCTVQCTALRCTVQCIALQWTMYITVVFGTVGQIPERDYLVWNAFSVMTQCFPPPPASCPALSSPEFLAVPVSSLTKFDGSFFFSAFLDGPIFLVVFCSISYKYK